MSEPDSREEQAGIELDADGIPILKEVVRLPPEREGIEEQLRRELQAMIGVAASRASSIVAKQVERELKAELERFLEQRIVELVARAMERQEGE